MRIIATIKIDEEGWHRIVECESMEDAECLCRDVAKNGIRINEKDRFVWFPSHRVVEISLRMVPELEKIAEENKN